jgi:hypothetical protein
LRFAIGSTETDRGDRRFSSAAAVGMRDQRRPRGARRAMVDARRVASKILRCPTGNFVQSGRRMPIGQGPRQEARSALKHRPANGVPQPLVMKHERANSFRQLIALPLALESPCSLALAFGCSSTCGLDRIGGRAKLVRDNMSAYAAYRAAPCRSLAAPIAWPPAVRASIILTSPRTQARACSIARRGRGSPG